MHLLHWLVNEQVPQYYFVWPTYVNIRNKSTMCICVCLCVCVNNPMRMDLWLLHYDNRDLSKTVFRHSMPKLPHIRERWETEFKEPAHWRFQTPRWLTDDRRSTMNKIITVFEYYFNIMEISIISFYKILNFNFYRQLWFMILTSKFSESKLSDIFHPTFQRLISLIF